MGTKHTMYSTSKTNHNLTTEESFHRLSPRHGHVPGAPTVNEGPAPSPVISVDSPTRVIEFGPHSMVMLERIASATELHADVTGQVGAALENALAETIGHRRGDALTPHLTADGQQPSANTRSSVPSRNADGPPDAQPDRIAGVESQLAEIKELLENRAHPVVKDFYTVAEVADRTEYEPWTIRNACRKGRIKAEKGPDRHWRISRDELASIQNHGLPKKPDAK